MSPEEPFTCISKTSRASSKWFCSKRFPSLSRKVSIYCRTSSIVRRPKKRSSRQRKNLPKPLKGRGKAFRFSRLRLIAYAEKNQRFAKLLAEEQTRLNKKFEEIFVLLKKKGWLNKGLDIKAVVIFIQAYTLGQIIDDVAGEKMSSEGWNHLIGQIIEKVLIAH